MKAEILDGLAGIEKELAGRAHELRVELDEVGAMRQGILELMNGHAHTETATKARIAKSAAKKGGISSSPASPAAKSAVSSSRKSRNGKPTNGERLIVLLDSGKKLTPASVAKRLKVDPNYACSLLREAVKCGLARNPTRGVYVRSGSDPNPD